MTNEVAEILLSTDALTDRELDILRARLIGIEKKMRCLDPRRPLIDVEREYLNQEMFLIRNTLHEYKEFMAKRERQSALQRAGFKLLRGGA